MDKVAFVFAGQGAQFPGMGKDLYEASPVARAAFDRAEALRPGTLDMCFGGAKEQLALTVNTQPCLFTMDYACARLAMETGMVPDMCAGFSLGEVAAAAFCGLMDFDTAFRLVVKRAEHMQACAERNPGLMYAVLKLSADQVRAMCAGLERAYPVNFNSPAQTVVACASESEAALLNAVKEAGGRAMKLNVSGAVHSPFMADATAAMRGEFGGVSFAEPFIPLYANRTALPYAAGAEAETLSEQISSPVLWCDTIENMWAAGARTFVEVGAGRTLCGLIKKIRPEATVAAVGDCAGLEALSALAKGDSIC